MPTADLLTIAESLRSAADALDAADARAKAAAELLRRCRGMCREDGMTLGPIAAALANEIDALIGGL